MFLRYNFWKIRKAARPSKEFRAALWQKLEQKIIEIPKQNLAPMKIGVRNDSIGLPFMLWRVPAMRYATVAMSLVLALGVGTGAYAYSSPEVNEAHPLYGLKKEIEKIEERVVARTPERKAIFQAKQMQRRLAEIENLQAKKLNFEKTMDEFNEA